MSVLVLGGDGYIGWPAAMYFSQRGFDVTVVDNYFRRRACTEIDVEMLYPVPTLVERARLWHKCTGKTIRVVIADLANPEKMRGLFSGDLPCAWPDGASVDSNPATVVHFAEQPSAPYSILSFEEADFTVVNNLRVTNNLIWAVKDISPDTHIVKLGTMGEYGTPNIDIEEGWLEIEHKGRKDRFLFPRQASSLYHTTKVMDTDLLWFAVRTWGLRVTDLMQGPVYGIETEESLIDPSLRTFFNYDEVFGTILNRFVVQAVCGYPLTVYGVGGQTRGYINLVDSLECVLLAANNPAPRGELKIFNQITETFSANDLAEIVRRAGRERDLDVTIDHISNPRKEAESHYYRPRYQGLVNMGLTPHLLTQDVVVEMLDVVSSFKSNIREETIFRGVRW